MFIIEKSENSGKSRKNSFKKYFDCAKKNPEFPNFHKIEDRPPTTTTLNIDTFSKHKFLKSSRNLDSFYHNQKIRNKWTVPIEN